MLAGLTGHTLELSLQVLEGAGTGVPEPSGGGNHATVLTLAAPRKEGTKL